MTDCSFAVCLGCVLLSGTVAASRVCILAGIYTLQTTMQYVQLTHEQVLFMCTCIRLIVASAIRDQHLAL